MVRDICLVREELKRTCCLCLLCMEDALRVIGSYDAVNHLVYLYDKGKLIEYIEKLTEMSSHEALMSSGLLK
jgi:hypothetical protein